jgi:hypothetical protein
MTSIILSIEITFCGCFSSYTLLLQIMEAVTALRYLGREPAAVSWPLPGSSGYHHPEGPVLQPPPDMKRPCRFCPAAEKRYRVRPGLRCHREHQRTDSDADLETELHTQVRRHRKEKSRQIQRTRPVHRHRQCGIGMWRCGFSLTVSITSSSGRPPHRDCCRPGQYPRTIFRSDRTRRPW